MNTLGIEMYEIIELEMDVTKCLKIETFRWVWININQILHEMNRWYRVPEATDGTYAEYI